MVVSRSPSPLSRSALAGASCRAERGGVRLRVVLALVVGGAMLWGWGGFGGSGELSVPRRLPLTPQARAATEARLVSDIEHLSLVIGERHLGRPESLTAAANWIVLSLKAAGWVVERHVVDVPAGRTENLSVERRGSSRPDEIVIIGAHYDTVRHSPGANANASGVAVTLALARIFTTVAPGRTLRFLFFTNAERPAFQTDAMGSLIYARECASRGEDIVAVVSLDSLGYFTDEPDSQHLPGPVAFLFPDEGDFVAVAGNLDSSDLVARLAAGLSTEPGLPVESGSLPAGLPGVSWSDHWSFWQCGYPGIVVTDTALYRDPQYHRWGDRPDRLDAGRLGQIVSGMTVVIDGLVQVDEGSP